MDQHEELSGIIDRFLFQNHENGYSVFVLQVNKTNSVVVKGHLSHIHPGEQVHLKGSWVVHPKFGRQFEAQQCSSQLPTSILGLKKYLSSGLIKGIGKVYAEKLVNHFRTEILEIIDKEPHRLQEIGGIGKKRVETIITAWQGQKEVASIMVFLQEKGVSPTFATKIFKKYGHKSIATLQENPYRLAEDIWGVGFKSADRIAQQLGFDTYSVKRIKAGILYAIGNETSNGHLYVELQVLKDKTITLLELESTQTEHNLKIALHELYDTDKIKLITHQDQHYITLSQYYFSEKGIAHKLDRLLEYHSPYIFDLDRIYTELRTEDMDQLALNDEQQKGILTCLQHKITVITGGPGTGKTTLIKRLLTILDQYNLQYKLAAPTGRAAKRIAEGTGRNALTLHRLLEFDPSTMSFVHNEHNALKLDFLIVDEASMIDVFLAHALLKAIPHHTHVLLIGDVDQLPSVGAGNFLQDIIASKKIPNIRLMHIFRQAQDSLIILNAHRINKGEFPTSYMPNSRKDYLFIKENKPEMVFSHLKKIIHIGLKKYHISSNNTSILVPMKRGVVGSHKLNQDLQTIINPTSTKQQLTYFDTIFKVDDKVMQIRNNYDKLVFNGDIGFIETINPEDRFLTVRFLDRLVEYEFDELNELILAYAITIHKSQGSEYDAVIVPLFMQHFMLLQRNLIYTAITRAKKLCIFIGEPKALAIAIKNNKTIIRKTFLKEFLTSDLACR